MSEPQNALFVVHGSSLLESIGTLLRRSDVTIHRMPAEAGSVELVLSSSFSLIVIEAPVGDRPTEDIVREVRDPASASRNAGLIVVAEDTTISELQPLVGRGVNRLIPASRAASELLIALGDLLQVEPRRPLRASLRVHVKASSAANTVFVQTENISSSGMLIRGSTRHFPPSTEVEFQLALPGQREALRGKGVVVRHTMPGTEPVQGFAIRFTDFQGNGSNRLKSYLAQES